MGAGGAGRPICIRPVGTIDEDVLRRLRKEIGDYLEAPVVVLDPVGIPDGSFEKGRNQYNSTKILKEVLGGAPPGAFKILGLIDRDLCIPILTFVFGEAQLGGIASVVSLARLRQEFHGLAPDARVFRDRLHKECLHELGHAFGLIHCPDGGCAMRLSNTVLDVDRKERTYCADCLAAVRAKIDSGRS